MPSTYCINDTVIFNTKQILLDFINKDKEFMRLVQSGLKKPLQPNVYPSDGDIILRISYVSDDGLNVYTELKKFDSLLSSPKYNWHRTYESIRHSGANYSDESQAQMKAFFDLDTIQDAISNVILQLNIHIG